MANLLILNASPRAPRSNSKEYARMVAQFAGVETRYCALCQAEPGELRGLLEDFTDLLLVFPLYVDAIPLLLLNFLKELERHPPRRKPTVSVLINCGFWEPWQNDVAVEMVRLYCMQQGYPFGSVLKIGSGEAILSTPFRHLLPREMKRLARSIVQRAYITRQVTMPIPKRLFVLASSGYWKRYGKKYGVSPEEMQTMEIESETES